MNPQMYEQEVRDNTIRMIRLSIFNLECVAHLRGKEAELLPLVEKLQEVLKALTK